MQKISILICLSFVASTGIAQEKPKIFPFQDRASIWIGQKWKADDKLFKSVRSSIEHLSPGTISYQQISLYKKAAQRKSTDQLAQFRWGYATYWRSRKSGSGGQLLGETVRALSKVPPPYAPEFARLRFLTEVALWPQPELKPLGFRLLKRDPKDYDVVYSMINLLNIEKSISERKRALDFAETLIHLKAGQAAPYSSLGWVYFRTWLITSSESDRTKSISAYKRYLRLAPHNAPFRSQAQRLLVMMNSKR